MISFEDHRGPNGNIDWAAYRKARVKAGEECWKCGTGIFFMDRTLGPCLCVSCKQLQSSQEACSHERLIRCPRCGTVSPTDDCDMPDRIFEDGEHAVLCAHCDHEFEVTTEVSFRFTSPPMEQKEPPEVTHA